MLEILNEKNETILLDGNQFVSFDFQTLQNPRLVFEFLLKNNLRSILFQLTEPDLDTGVPKVSEVKMGTLQSFSEENKVEIKLKDDFLITSPEEEEQMQIYNLNYYGNGIY